MKLPQRFLKWPRRGFEYEGLTNFQSECLIRCNPEDDMNGFFIALFVRRPILGSSTEISTNERPSKRLISSTSPKILKFKRQRLLPQNQWKVLHKTLAY